MRVAVTGTKPGAQTRVVVVHRPREHRRADPEQQSRAHPRRHAIRPAAVTTAWARPPRRAGREPMWARRPRRSDLGPHPVVLRARSGGRRAPRTRRRCRGSARRRPRRMRRRDATASPARGTPGSTSSASAVGVDAEQRVVVDGRPVADAVPRRHARTLPTGGCQSSFSATAFGVTCIVGSYSAPSTTRALAAVLLAQLGRTARARPAEAHRRYGRRTAGRATARPGTGRGRTEWPRGRWASGHPLVPGITGA